ncbi:MAG: hypothetical protein ACI9U2_000995 [Bradymonadia bacterium]|jgi:hypothetical protein
MRRLSKRPIFLLWAILLCVAPGCSDAGSVNPLPAEHPRRLLESLEAFAQTQVEAPSPDKARAFLEAFAVTKPEMLQLFGPERGEKAWAGYTAKVLPALRAEAGAVLTREIVEEKRTTAWVEPVGPAYPAATTRGDQLILDALVDKRPVYTARLRRDDDTLGLRLNGFIYIGGAWKSLFKVYEYL